MTNIAYSYLRFSTPEQASGDSRRRQLSLAEKYAADHHLKLDRQLSFRDLGVSAFRGRNAKEGALRAFLEAIEHNLVPQNSVLLIESLDRLSRDRILSAQALFMQIIQAGITIVTLVDQRSYSFESVNRNPLDLIISLVRGETCRTV
jgi:DNA invertase Pin-like site-specific DNA recombinase